MLAGVVVTMAKLRSMDFTTIAWFRPAASDACMARAECYPLRWLTARHSRLVISKEAPLRDSSQWALGCTFFFQAEDGIRDLYVTGVQTCALPIFCGGLLCGTLPSTDGRLRSRHRTGSGV